MTKAKTDFDCGPIYDRKVECRILANAFLRQSAELRLVKSLEPSGNGNAMRSKKSETLQRTPSRPR